MKKFTVLASQLIYLETIVEAETEEQAKQLALDNGNWKDYEAERVTLSDCWQNEEV